MTERLGEIIKEARQARHLTLRGLTEQVTKEDGKPISPQYLFDIEEHHRMPAPHVLRELARVLDLDYDRLLAVAGAADTVVREYLAAHPQQSEAVIKLFREAQQGGFEDWEKLRSMVDGESKIPSQGQEPTIEKIEAKKDASDSRANDHVGRKRHR
jgi:transcriptional regulator with XRE-family HTH domain